MFRFIFKYELGYLFRNPAVYIYGSVSFLFGLITMAGNAGAFNDTGVLIHKTANSPYALFSLMSMFSKLIIFMIPAIIGNSVFRDFKTNSHSILFSYPVKKISYLSGKFLSSFTCLILISLLFFIGCYFGTQLPGTDKMLITTFQLSVYLQMYLFYLIPDLLFTGILVFSITVLTRRSEAGFMIIVILLILRELILRLTAGTDMSFAAMIFEPFGETATNFYTGVWSFSEHNSNGIPFGKYIILNRVCWIIITTVISVITYNLFSLSYNKVSFIFRKIKNKVKTPVHSGSIIRINLPVIKYNYSIFSCIKSSWIISGKEFYSVIKDGPFKSIVIAGSVFVYVMLSQMNAPYGVKVLPVTWVMLAFPVLFFSLLINFVTFLYSGVLVNRAGTYRMDQLTDTTAMPNWSLTLSKLFTLIKIQSLLLSVILLTGIFVQISGGYYNIELSHYIFDLYVIHLSGFVIWAFAALFIQSLFSNTASGLLFLILIFFGVSEIHLAGIEKFIYRFNQNPIPGFYLNYSDLSGYGHSLIPYFIYKAYWFLLGIFIFTITFLFLKRGLYHSLRERFVTATDNIRIRTAIPLTALLIIFLGTGFLINYNEVNSIRILSQNDKDKILSEADNKYGHLRNFVQPRIVSVNVRIDLFPEESYFLSKGNYILVNRSDTPVESLLVNSSLDVSTEFHIDKENNSVLTDTLSGFAILKLKHKLLPGDSINFSFEVKSIANSLFYNNSKVEKNGTYITSLIYPSIGYRPYNYSAEPFDSSALNNHYRSFDSDYIDLEVTVSTSEDQIAVAPGYVRSKWQDNNRNYFHYCSDSPVTNDFAIVSGKFEIARDKWNDVDIEIYHYKEHSYNINHMINGLKSTLEYCGNNFSPYQHRQIRIIEYSRSIGEFAQSFANTIPYSETGFIIDIDDKRESGINLPFAGASHELAHQWWGMQVIPADVKGSKMVTESMAEYVSLKVIEKEYGRNKALEFLEKSMNTYLKNSNENEGIEPPLIYNTGNEKAFIPYQKGMLALNAMSYYLGEEKFNNALKNYIQKAKFRGAPYTTSVEFTDHIRNATPDSLKYLIHDLFETVTFYDNRIMKSETAQQSKNEYEIRLSFEVNKYKKSGDGNINSPLPPDDLIQIGFYKDSSDEIPFEYKWLRVIQKENHIKFVLDYKPEKIILDPNFLIIDKNTKDNILQF